MSPNSVQRTIQDKIKVSFSPLICEVLNESSSHNVPKDSETHFKITMVSSQFEGVARVKRHQLVYKALDVELKSGVHALALHLFTPEEWKGSSPESPKCLGGEK